MHRRHGQPVDVTFLLEEQNSLTQLWLGDGHRGAGLPAECHIILAPGCGTYHTRFRLLRGIPRTLEAWANSVLVGFGWTIAIEPAGDALHISGFQN